MDSAKSEVPEGLSSPRLRLQIHQYNDPEILEFFIKYRVEYVLVGDHLFDIRTREGRCRACPGDWLVAGPDGEVVVEKGDYRRRAQRMIDNARRDRRDRDDGLAA